MLWKIIGLNTKMSTEKTMVAPVFGINDRDIHMVITLIN